MGECPEEENEEDKGDCEIRSKSIRRQMMRRISSWRSSLWVLDE